MKHTEVETPYETNCDFSFSLLICFSVSFLAPASGRYKNSQTHCELCCVYLIAAIINGCVCLHVRYIYNDALHGAKSCLNCCLCIFAEEEA